MIYTITWTEEALSTFEERIAYLEMHWTQREIVNFKSRVIEYLKILQAEPLIAKRPGRFKNVHIGLVLKQVSLVYRVKPVSKEIELIAFIDNRQNPKKIKNYKPRS